MKSKFPLFQSHLDLAHTYWQSLLRVGDIAIDATCGNGQDTLLLAQLCLNDLQGLIYAIDILPKAVELSKVHLQNNLNEKSFQRIHWHVRCHSQFPQEIATESVKLIVYNLGYLPGGGNKNLTTQVETTLQSLKQALQLIQPGGAVSMTLYPGHSEGEKEEHEILKFVKELSPFSWNCCHHRWLNRAKSPSLLLIQKQLN